MRHSNDSRCWLRRSWCPVEDRPAERELAPKPERACGGSRKTEDHRRITQRRCCHCPRTDALDINKLQTFGELDGECQCKSGAAEQQSREHRARPPSAIEMFLSIRHPRKPFGNASKNLAQGNEDREDNGVVEMREVIEGK